MKKLILCSLLCIGLMSGAMSQSPAVQTMAQSGDTVTNTETEYLTLTITGDYSTVTFQYVCNELSGTTAGTATLQASLNGSNWIALDTVTNTDVASQTFKLDFPTRNVWKFYRLKCTGSGTMAARVYCYVLPKK